MEISNGINLFLILKMLNLFSRPLKAALYLQESPGLSRPTQMALNSGVRPFGLDGSYTTSSVRQTEDGGYIAGMTGSSWQELRNIKRSITGIPNRTERLAESPAQPVTSVPFDTSTIIPPKKTAGFEVVLAITILLAVYIIGRKRR